MDLLLTFGRTMAFSLAAGVNLYATVAIIGLAARYEWVTLPESYQGFAHPWVIGVALVLYAVEFVADKVPWVDSAWDAVHTVVRPLGAALIAVASIGDASPLTTTLVALAGGTVAAGSHLTKAGTRVAVNASPEPFSNWALSFGEDAFVVGLGLLALKFPLAALAVTGLALLAIGLVARWIWTTLRKPRLLDSA
ncbi:MAG: DUF4126 domain-containing protein [Vicinamibacterales bacterium]